MWIEATTLLHRRSGQRQGVWSTIMSVRRAERDPFNLASRAPVPRPDRQVASRQSAKLQPRVRFPLRPRIARVAERLGTSLPRKIMRIRVPSLAPARPRCFWLHACLPGRRSGSDSRWSLSRTVGLVVGFRPSKPVTRVRFSHGAQDGPPMKHRRRCSGFVSR